MNIALSVVPYDAAYYQKTQKNRRMVCSAVSSQAEKCSGNAASGGAIYASEGHGFLCMRRCITEKLVEQGYCFCETDAWLDLWCHTVWGDPHNAFSRLAPVVQIMRRQPVLTLASLGARWGWEKTKVWRFFQKYAGTFSIYKLPGSYGCLLFNQLYPTDTGPMEAPNGRKNAFYRHRPPADQSIYAMVQQKDLPREPQQRVSLSMPPGC